MADAITTARQAIEGRIHEIEEEAGRLRNALAALIGGPSARGRSQAGSASRQSGRKRKVAPPGRRREQLLSHLEKNPGAKPSEIAKAIGTTPANVHNVLRKARQDKVVRRERGGGYALTSRAKTTSTTAKPKRSS